ncbi:hypothetical protein [Telmatospirillum sp.]|uniref:hypothetical protein n=1 Tax=Telmatospirillum sp. TaxID=2079197 RepID=UPI00284EC548|nr:hypothetical protein [Telmatospirillum sp.]MDR3436533.1 hypothetical protein [Telmatospirillum sp.]
MIIAGIENAVVVGALGALGAGLYSLGIPKDSIVNYQTHIETDKFLVVAHGSPAELARAKATLGQSNATSIDIHPGVSVRHKNTPTNQSERCAEMGLTD